MAPARAVKIVATLGPATSSPERVEELVRAGVDVVRLNFSHGTREEHGERIRIARSVARKLNKPVAVMQDLQGPRIRTGRMVNDQPVELVEGARIDISGKEIDGTRRAISTTHDGLPRYLKPGQRVLLDNGLMEIGVEYVEGDLAICRVVHGGFLGSNKGINIPGADLGIPSFTEKDREDLEFALERGIDYIAMSFVQSGSDIRPVRDILKKHRKRTPVIAKIERAKALHNLEGIVNAFDGLMVARGDLGVEQSPEEVPVWQKRMLRKARRRGKVAIVATQMLESMITEPRPTRAEASDVANAVLDGADAVMLSGETAIGDYPTETVSVMRRIISRAETIYEPEELSRVPRYRDAEAVARAACSLATDLNNTALVVLTRHGLTASLVSRCRPPAPVYALTHTEEMAQQIALWWGITPIVVQYPTTTDEALKMIDKVLVQKGHVSRDDHVVVVGSTPFARRGRTNFLKVHRIGG